MVRYCEWFTICSVFVSVIKIQISDDWNSSDHFSLWWVVRKLSFVLRFIVLPFLQISNQCWFIQTKCNTSAQKMLVRKCHRLIHRSYNSIVIMCLLCKLLNIILVAILWLFFGTLLRIHRLSRLIHSTIFPLVMPKIYGNGFPSKYFLPAFGCHDTLSHHFTKCLWAYN